MSEKYIDKDFLSDNNDDNASFTKLFRYYYQRVATFISSIVGDNVAEDITQDTFLYLWKNMKKISLDKGIRSYLYKIAYSRSLDHIRKTKIIDNHHHSIYKEYTHQQKNLLEDNSNTLNQLYSEEFYFNLFHLLDEVQPERKQVFIMAYIDGMKSKDIAKKLSIPCRTVESHLYLTLKYIKKKMSKENFFFTSSLLFLEGIF